MLRQMPREAQDFARERDQARNPRISRIEPGCADALRVDALPVPPLDALREAVDLLGLEPQGLADVPQRAARTVADDGGGERGALAAVLAVNVLNDLFAPLMFEIHVDVGRLVALLRNEALEQHRHARRIDLGDPQAIADRGVGRGPAPLAKNALRARELHDVVHGQKERLVAEFGDQAQLVLDALAHLLRRTRRPTFAGAAFREIAQMTRRRRVRGHDLLGILVAQFIEAEPAALGDLERGREQRRGIQLLQTAQGTQAAFAVRKQRETRRMNRGVQPNGRQHVLQRAAAAPMHVHVAGGDPGNIQRLAERFEQRETARIEAARQQLDAEPQAPGEALAQPAPLLLAAGFAAPCPHPAARSAGSHRARARDARARADSCPWRSRAAPG